MASSNKALNLKIKVNDTQVDSTLKELNGQFYKLRNSVNKLEEGTEEWYEAQKKLALVERDRKKAIENQRIYRKELLKTIDAEEHQNEVLEEFSGNLTELFTAIRAGDLLAFRTAWMGLAGGIRAATSAAMGFIATPMGATLLALAGIALATREWFRYNEESREANMLTQQITRLSGEALDQARVRATAIEKTFGTDFKESLTAASTLVEAFGISYEEAFDRIEDGLIRGGKENSEFMDSIKEYPKLFAQAGFSVEDFQRLLNTGIDLKIYSDKLPDAIKEFSLSVREQTTASRDALENAFGKQFTDELFKNINNGSITVKDALELVASEAENIGLNAQQSQQLTADLFRGAGEDAGGALLIFEAVNQSLSDQARALTPLEQELQRVADANKRLERAQNDALKSDQYSAFVNNIEVAWINFKAGFFEGMNGVLEGLATADTAFRKFVFQSVQYVKDAFTIGADADWEALGKQFDEQQKKIEKAASDKKKKENKEQDPEYIAKQEALRKQREAEEKAAAEAEKLKEERAKAALDAEKQRLETLENLQKEYTKRREDRLANTALKKAELDKQRALQELNNLQASQELIDQVTAEHDAKIEEARKLKEEKELADIAAFREKKQALIDELRISQKETDQERELEEEELRYEKELEKFQEEMERLKLNKQEKDEVIQILEQKHQDILQDIRDKANNKKLESDRELYETRKKLINDSLNAAINAAGSETKVGQALLLAKQIMAAREMAIQLGLFKSKMALNVAEATGDTAKGLAKTTSAAPFPANIPLIIGFAAQVAGIIGAIKSASQTGSSVKTSGFYYGGDTGSNGLGFIDDSGHEPVGYVHKNEYVIPEVLRKDPEMPQIENYIEKKRRKKLGLYYDGGPTSSPDSDPENINPIGSGSDAMLTQAIYLLMERLDIPLEAVVYYDAEAEIKRQETQKKVDRLKNKSKIKN